MPTQIPSQSKINEIAEKGEAIYKKIKDKLEPENVGKIVAINVDTGEYFLGKDTVEADHKARDKYPDAVFHLVRVGYPAVHSFKGWQGLIML